MHAFLSSAICFRNQLFRKIRSGIHRCVEQCLSRSGPTFRQARSGPNFSQKLSADDTRRQRVNPACYINRITLSILEIHHYLSSYSTAESNGQCKIVLVDNGGLISLNRADLDPLCSRHEHRRRQTWPRGYKTFLCSTQLSMKFILLINVKMPTIVGILTFVSRINTIATSFKAR